jgi:hypothetical protein
MNERIRELAEQTKEFMDGSDDLDTFIENFAVLIVRKCAELIDNKVTITAAETYDEVFVAKFDTKELCAKQIREHFGVE